MTETLTSVEIFCSYSHADEVWLCKLESHLSSLKQQGLISLWHDRLIIPGENWARAIDTHLETASIILLLVSPHFLASDYCCVEMKRALEREEAGEARVVPILVHPAGWQGTPFAHLQVVPTGARPIVSWTDEDTAFADVTAGIRRVIEDVPLLAASAPRAVLPTIWNVPYPRNPFFLGRDTELAQVRHHLQGGQATALSQPQAISGLGGIGKTQLALEYAYRSHQDYQMVLWAGAQSREALISSYVSIAALLRLPEREVNEQDITVQAVKIWLQTHRGWLLILDNADELTLIPDFLPPTLGGHLLLTTQATATGRLAHRLEIETLLPEQGALFLLRRAALIAPDALLEHASSQEQELAVQISQELGGLPLALDQAGAYLEEIGTDLAGYWQIYQQHRADLLRERRGFVRDHPAPVATTWSLSFRRVEERNPAAAELLRLCAYLAPDAIPEEILTASVSLLGPVLAPVAADPFQLNQSIEALRSYSLVKRDPKGKTLSIHRLVQAVLQDALSETEVRSWAMRAMLSVNATFPHVEHDTWSQCERLLPHALLVAQYIERHQITGKEARRLLYETASYFRDRGRYSEAEPLYLRALRIYEQQSGPEHHDVADPLNDLATLYLYQGKYEQAEPLYLRALQIREQQHEHHGVASALKGLANLYVSQGKYEQAEPLYRRAIQIYEQQSELEHHGVASALNGLAVLYVYQGKYEQTEPLYLRALQIWERQLGPQHPNVAYTLSNLATLYLDLGQYTEAEPLYRRALQICEQQLGPEHHGVAYPLNGLANLYLDLGQYTEAESLYHRALQICEQLGSEHPDVADPLNGLANLYLYQGKYEQAEPLYLRALHIREKVMEPGESETANIMHDLARLREAQGNSEEARILYERALAIREKALGHNHPKTTKTRKCFITLLHTMGHHEEATLLETEPRMSEEEQKTHLEETD